MTTNENKDSSGGRSKSNDNNIKKEYIQKLSNEKALAEAILIGNKPCFAVVDFSDRDDASFHDDGPTIAIMESLSYSEDTRLVPELLSNRPYSFKDKEEFYSCIEKAKTETLDSLFDNTMNKWRKFIDADDFHLKICGADTMFTYFQDRIGTTHYLFFIADNDAGKSNNLKLFNILGYRNLMNTTMTHANVYNFLGHKEEGAGTICIDEADSIDQYPEIMSILKSGYTKGFPVVRIIDTPHGRKQVKFNTYCFKALAGEKLPDEVEARGFMQRTIVIKCIPGFPRYDISEVTDPAGDTEYEGLLNELNELRNLLFCYRLIHFKDKIPNINLNIRNREKQLFKPLLRIFQGTDTFDILRPVISKYINEKRESKANSLHAFLYRIIRNLTESQGRLELQFSNIWNFIKMNVEWEDVPHKAQSIETVEFGTLSQKGVSLTLKNVFGAKPPKHTASSRSLIFSQHVLDRMKDTYEMNIEIKVDFETHETLETLVGSMDAYTDSSEDINKENIENNQDNEKNIQESNIESKNDSDKEVTETDIHASSQNASQASQASQTEPSDCNLVNQEEADRFTDEVKRLSKEEIEE